MQRIIALIVCEAIGWPVLLFARQIDNAMGITNNWALRTFGTTATLYRLFGLALIIVGILFMTGLLDFFFKS